MKVYLVGGAVRDELLGLKVVERDYVVVGAEEDDMLKAGFQKVGKDFPVFLHPETKEEYALARKERKVGRGYKGFSFDASKTITLEEDLSRRDLTINAIAKDETGKLIDPFDGQGDLKQKKLRHVSEAFIEDPLRVLRVARFAARFAHLGFQVDENTNHLMYQMAKGGELEDLVSERVWIETQKAFKEQTPSVYFKVLREAGALSIIFPEIHALFGVPQTAKWHGEIDTGVHTMMVVDKASILSEKLEVRFASLCHDLGKAVTPFNYLPSHHGHDEKGVSKIMALCERLRVPKRFESLAVLVSRYHSLLHKIRELTPKRVVKLLDELDAYRRVNRFYDFLVTCQADALGRLGGDGTYMQADYLKSIYLALKKVALDKDFIEKNTGEAIKKALYEKRLTALKHYLKEGS